MLGNIMGGVASSNYGPGLANQNAVYGAMNQAAMANNAYAQNQAAFQQMAAQQAVQQAMSKRSSKPEWMFDGKVMDLVGFAHAVFGEDTPEATHFVLKYSK